MEQLLILLLIWFLIDGLGGNKRKQEQRRQRQLKQQQSAENFKRALQDSRDWWDQQASKDELQQRQLRDLQESQRAERQVAANKRKIQGKTIIFGDLGDFIREFRDLMDVGEEPEVRPTPEPEREQPVFSEMSHEDIARRKQELREKRNRRLTAKKARPVVAEPDDECEYCTGELEVEPMLVHHTEAAEPVVLTARPTRDVETACRELQLNRLQEAVVWSEVLDKPLALRKRR